MSGSRQAILRHVVGPRPVMCAIDDGEASRHARDLYAAGVRGLRDDPRRPGLDLDVRLAVEDGDPVQMLAAVGREEAAALLLTGTRGRNPLSSALLGSVSVGLVGAAGRPVALVPASAGERPAG